MNGLNERFKKTVEKNGLIDVAKKLLKNGMDIALINEITGLPIEEIKELI